MKAEGPRLKSKPCKRNHEGFILLSSPFTFPHDGGVNDMAAPNELSFLPDDYLERKARRRTNAICAVLFCVVISGIGGAFTVTERSMREIEDQCTKVQDQYNNAAKRIEQVQQMQDKQ